MSLSAELNDPHSRIRQHVEFVAGTVSCAKRGSLLDTTRVLGLDSLPTSVESLRSSGADAGTVGTAFDYRLRYHLASSASRDFTARLGAIGVCRTRPDLTPQVSSFFADLDELSWQLPSTPERLAAGDEVLLCRYCVVLALFESVYRSRGRSIPALLGSPPTVESGIPWPLRLADEVAVSDVMRLSRSAEETVRQLIVPVRSGQLPYVSNPRFSGSDDVRGADADFIIGDTTFEVKTTAKLTAAAVREALFQLVGYVLLDYDDHYAIRKVAAYFARQEFVRGWPLWQVVFPPPQVLRWLTQGTEPTDTEVTERLHKVRTLMRVACTGGSIDYESEFG